MIKEVIGPATLYQADARDALGEIANVEAVVTDPPYGVGGALNSRTGARKRTKKNDYEGFDDSPEYVRDVVIPIIEICIKKARGVALTPGNRCIGLYPNPAAFGAVFQPASVGLQAWGRADAQPIFYYGASPHGGKALPAQACSIQLAGESAGREAVAHPCPKPMKLARHLVLAASLRGETVLDPFMGSGTTGVAAVALGRLFIGVERCAAYFDFACRRIEAAVRQGPEMIAEPAPRPTQERLDWGAA